jgi:hypothetical protein
MKFMLGGSYIYEKSPEPDFIQAHHHHFTSFPKKDPVNFDLRFKKRICLGLLTGIMK